MDEGAVGKRKYDSLNENSLNCIANYIISSSCESVCLCACVFFPLLTEFCVVTEVLLW